MRGYQEITAAEKYRVWERNQLPQLDTIQNHRGFTVDPFLNNLTSRFNPTEPTITIKTDLVDVPGTTGGDVQFKDPWYIDFDDPNYGNAPRNRGQNNAVLYTRSVGAIGFKPDYTTQYDGGRTYKGVFLNQQFASGNYYSVGAPNPNPIAGFTAYFQNWTGTNVQYQNANAAQTGVVFLNAGATATAMYKAQFGSSTLSAISNSNQRKIIRAWNGYYFACYESGGHIWLTRSTDNGATWSPEKRMSDDVSGFTNRAPSVSMSYLTPNKVLVAWEAYGYTGNYVNRVYVRAIDPVVFATVEHKNLITVQSSYPFSAMPVLAPTFALSTYPSLLAWYDPAGPYIKGYIVDYSIYGTLYQGPATSLTIVPNEVSSPLWLDPTWRLAWANGSTLYSMTAYRNSNFQLVAFPPEVVTDYGGGLGDLSMISINGQPAISWIDNGLASGPGGGSSSYSVRYRERSSGGWNTPITIWPDVYGGVSSTSLTYNSSTNSVSVFWQGGSSIRHAQRTGGSWYSVATIVAGATPSVSVSTPGNTGGTSEILLSRSGSSAPYAIQRTTINYGSGDGAGSITSENEGGKGLSPDEDSTVVQGRGGYVQFPNGSMHIALLAASINGRVLRFPAINDTLHVLRRQQIDSAATTLPLVGVGLLDLKVLYRSSGVIPNAAQFGLEVREANSGVLLGKLRAFSNVGDTIVTLHVPLSFAGRSVRVGLGASNMNDARGFTLERWFVPPEGSSAPLVNRQKVQQAFELPTVFALHQNYPNPFNPSTQIKFDLPENGNVSLVVYDVLGRKVTELLNGRKEAGYQSATWDASNVASGMYFARFTATDASGNVKLSKVNKLLLTK